MIGGLLCILQAEHGDRRMKQAHLSYRLRQAVHIINADFVVCIKTSVSVCHHYKNLRKI